MDGGMNSRAPGGRGRIGDAGSVNPYPALRGHAALGVPGQVMMAAPVPRQRSNHRFGDGSAPMNMSGRPFKQ